MNINISNPSKTIAAQLNTTSDIIANIIIIIISATKSTIASIS
jgi:hypothetical protein